MGKRKKIKKETGNLLSDTTDGKITSVEFGGDIPELGFDVDKWNSCYGSTESLRYEAAERLRQKNKARVEKGLPPI